MKIAVFGPTGSGKSTLGWIIAAEAARERKGPLVGVLSEQTSITAFNSLVRFPGILIGAEKRVARTLGAARSAVRQAAGGCVLLDTRSELYGRAIETFRDASQEARERADLRSEVRMSPESWGAINRAVREAIDEPAAAERVDIVEILRSSPVYSNDLDFGRIQSEGIDGRGESEAGRGGELVIVLRGGLRSAGGSARSLRVVSDLSATANGLELHLPQIAGVKDVRALRHLIREKLLPTFRALREISDPARDEWASLLESEIPDEWSQAEDLAKSARAGQIAGQIKGLLAMHGLMGQDGASKTKRAALLMRLWNVGHPDDLRQKSAEDLEVGMRQLEAEMNGEVTP